MQLQEIILRRCTPVVINSFNQHYYLKNIVEKFLDSGFQNIFIFDNASSYPELLEYLEHIKIDNRILPIYYEKNNGPRYFFQNKIYASIFGEIPFIYTDPDLTWVKFADDYLSNLIQLSHKYKTFKVGSALTMPCANELKEGLPKIDVGGSKLNVIEFESQYWVHELEPNVYNSPIDTTLHLFNPKYYNNGTIISGLRVAGLGYEIKHTPWFKNDPCPSEEIKFYQELDSGWRNWV